MYKIALAPGSPACDFKNSTSIPVNDNEYQYIEVDEDGKGMEEFGSCPSGTSISWNTVIAVFKNWKKPESYTQVTDNSFTVPALLAGSAKPFNFEVVRESDIVILQTRVLGV
jgi:hypothetical protein